MYGTGCVLPVWALDPSVEKSEWLNKVIGAVWPCFRVGVCVCVFIVCFMCVLLCVLCVWCVFYGCAFDISVNCVCFYVCLLCVCLLCVRWWCVLMCNNVRSKRKMTLHSLINNLWRCTLRRWGGVSWQWHPSTHIHHTHRHPHIQRSTYTHIQQTNTHTHTHTTLQ